MPPVVLCVLGATSKRWTSSASVASVISWSGEMSVIHRLRPKVATTRSFSRGWMRRSVTLSQGMFALNGHQALPPSSVT